MVSHATANDNSTRKFKGCCYMLFIIMFSSYFDYRDYFGYLDTWPNTCNICGQRGPDNRGSTVQGNEQKVRISLLDKKKVKKNIFRNEQLSTCRNDNGLKEQGQDDYFSQLSILLTCYQPTYKYR